MSPPPATASPRTTKNLPSSPPPPRPPLNTPAATELSPLRPSPRSAQVNGPASPAKPTRSGASSPTPLLRAAPPHCLIPLSPHPSPPPPRAPQGQPRTPIQTSTHPSSHGADRGLVAAGALQVSLHSPHARHRRGRACAGARAHWAGYGR